MEMDWNACFWAVHPPNGYLGNEHKKGSDAGAFGDSTEKKDRRSEEEKQAV